MTFFKSNGDRVPAVIEKLAESAKAGEMDRREFLAMASVMGASTAMARPHHPRPHKICKVERHHGHVKKVCRWVR